MSELTFEQMLEESLKTIHAGEVVEGTVIDVKPEEIILNIGYKSDGILTKNEYTNDSSVDLTTVAKVGDTMEVKVLKVNDGEGQVLLTYKRLAADRGNKRIEEAFNNHEVLKATVSQVLDGGLSVIVDEVRIFIPASLVSDTYEKDLTKYAGQEIEFVISEYNPKRRRYIGDRKQLIVAKKAELQKELFEKIKEGDIVEGVVKNVTDFGAFIDLGGADGLLHISEMSWGRVEHPKKVFKVGDKLIFEDMAIYSMVKNNTFDWKGMDFHILSSQYNTVYCTKPCICHQNTGKLKLSYHIFKLDFAFIKTERTEDTATSFHGNIFIIICCLQKSSSHNIKIHWITLNS